MAWSVPNRVDEKEDPSATIRSSWHMAAGRRHGLRWSRTLPIVRWRSKGREKIFDGNVHEGMEDMDWVQICRLPWSMRVRHLMHYAVGIVSSFILARSARQNRTAVAISAKGADPPDRVVFSGSFRSAYCSASTLTKAFTRHHACVAR